MRVSKNPPVQPDPSRKFALTEKRTFQLARVAASFGNSEWLLLSDACSLALRTPGSEVFTGYFEPKSAIVKAAHETARRLLDASI